MEDHRMVNLPPNETEAEGLKRLEAWMEQRTEGLRRHVSVEMNDGGLIVHGTTEWPAVRDVASLALFVLLGAVQTSRVELCVERVEGTAPVGNPSTPKE